MKSSMKWMILFGMLWNVAHSASLDCGILVPLPIESQALLSLIKDAHPIQKRGITYLLGKIGDKRVVFLNTGLGKVNAAVGTTRLIQDFHPKRILLSGSSGSLNASLHAGDIVVGKEVVDVDLGQLTDEGSLFLYNSYLENPQNKKILPLHFPADAVFLQAIKKLSYQKSNVILGKIATTDALPNPITQIHLLKKNHFDVVDMESAAVMQTCWIFQTHCFIIRGVSNSAEKNSTSDHIISSANHAADFLSQLIQVLPS